MPRTRSSRDVRDRLVQALHRELVEAGVTIAAAESCTGGAVSSALTSLAGASAFFLGGVVAYTEQSKIEWVGVPAELIHAETAVSGKVASAMAEGIRARFGSTFGLGVTGYAGPQGGTALNPVGTVYIAVAGPNGTYTERLSLSGGRAAVIRRASVALLRLLLRELQDLERLHSKR